MILPNPVNTTRTNAEDDSSTSVETSDLDLFSLSEVDGNVHFGVDVKAELAQPLAEELLHLSSVLAVLDRHLLHAGPKGHLQPFLPRRAQAVV